MIYNDENSKKGKGTRADELVGCQQATVKLQLICRYFRSRC